MRKHVQIKGRSQPQIIAKDTADIHAVYVPYLEATSIK